MALWQLPDVSEVRSCLLSWYPRYRRSFWLQTLNSVQWVSRALIYLVSLRICVRFASFSVGLSIVLPVVFLHIWRPPWRWEHSTVSTVSSRSTLQPWRITEVKDHWSARWPRSDQHDLAHLAYFGTEAVVLDDVIGGCLTENHAQMMRNRRVRSPYACLVTAQLVNIYNHVVFLFIRYLNNEK